MSPTVKITVSYGDDYDTAQAPNTVDITLLANWTANTYTVEYNGNGDTSGSMTRTSHTYDTVANLSENMFTRTGYTFLGWSTDPDASSATYTDQGSVKNLTSENNGTVTLYAVWQPITYSIRFNGNGNTGGSMADQSMTYGVAAELNRNSFEKSDYGFSGWATSNDGSIAFHNGASVNNLSSTQDDIFNLYALWTQLSHTVTFDYNGGTGSPKDTESKQFQNNTAYGDLPDPTKSNALFCGWYKSENYNNEDLVMPTTIAATTLDHELHAKWLDTSKTNDYTLTAYGDADFNNDKLPDNMSVTVSCMGNFDRYTIPLQNLKPNTNYSLTCTVEGVNSSFYGRSSSGYTNALFGSFITTEAFNGSKNGGKIHIEHKDVCVTHDIIADTKRKSDDTQFVDINQYNFDITLNFRTGNNPNTYYWVWDFGLFRDSTNLTVDIKNISLKEGN